MQPHHSVYSDPSRALGPRSSYVRAERCVAKPARGRYKSTRRLCESKVRRMNQALGRERRRVWATWMRREGHLWRFPKTELCIHRLSIQEIRSLPRSDSLFQAWRPNAIETIYFIQDYLADVPRQVSLEDCSEDIVLEFLRRTKFPYLSALHSTKILTSNERHLCYLLWEILEPKTRSIFVLSSRSSPEIQAKLEILLDAKENPYWALEDVKRFPFRKPGGYGCASLGKRSGRSNEE